MDSSFFFLYIFVVWCVWTVCGVLTILASYFLNGDVWTSHKDYIAMILMGPIGFFIEIGIWLTDN